MTREADYSCELPALIERLGVVETACLNWQGPTTEHEMDEAFVRGVGLTLVKFVDELDEMSKGHYPRLGIDG